MKSITKCRYFGRGSVAKMYQSGILALRIIATVVSGWFVNELALYWSIR